MSKRFSWFFLLASGVFFLFIVGLTGYRIEEARGRNTALARERSSALTAKVLSLRDITGGFDAPQFKADMRALFTSEPRLLLVSLHSSHDGILYYIARGRSYLTNPQRITAEWRGTPAYRVSGGYEVLVSTNLRDGGAGVTLDSLFLVLGREDLYPVVRDDLYLLLAFLLVCGVGILIMMSIQQEPSRSAVPAADQRVSSSSGAGASSSTASSSTASPALSAPRFGSPEAAAARDARQADRALVSPHTGLVWADHLEPRLKAELERASSSDQDISLALIRIDKPLMDAKLPQVYAEIARILKDSYPILDLIFEAADEGYAIIMPDNDVDAAVRTLEKIRTRAAEAVIEGKNRTVSIGVSSRGGRLIEKHVLLEEANVAAAKASREGGNQVIGFRADASRFRNALSEKLT